MGYAVATVRLMCLNAERLDLEYKLQLIADAKMNLGMSLSELDTIGTDMSPESPVIKRLEQRKERLYLLEKKLDMQMEKYKLRLRAIEAEYQSCQAMVDRNIQRMFKY